VLTSSGRWVGRGMAVIATVAGLALPLAAASPASADQVRDAQQWVLDALNVPSAWHVSQGRGVLVAVIDSGVNPGVSDLAGSVTSGPDLTGVGTPVTSPSWGMHGTWMASLIAGHGHGRGELDGIRGVAPQARILSIRVITDRTDPGYSRYQSEPPSRGQHELAEAIRYAVSHGAGVISMSLGYDAPSLVVRAALQDALNHNVVVVASSGNSGTAQTARGQGHAPYSFPADYLGVLGVAAVNRAGLPAYFSSENLSVQVAAPGVNVPSQGRDGRYWLVSGTSPACALTAGVAALIKSRYPTLTAAQIRHAIASAAQHKPAGGYDDQVGFGTVDAMSALSAAGVLTKQPPEGNSAVAKAHAAGYFGDGPAAVPQVPVAPRGDGLLLTFCALAAVCLLFIVAAGRWITAPRQSGYRAGAAVVAGPVGAGGLGQAGVGQGVGAAWTGPASGFDGTAVDLRFPQPGYPPQPQPGQGYPGQGYPGQPYPGQSPPGQPYPGQSPPGQGYPGPPYPSSGQGYPGQPSAGQPYPAPGQGYPGQPYEVRPQAGQPYPSHNPAGPHPFGQLPPGQLPPGQTQPDQPQRGPWQPRRQPETMPRVPPVQPGDGGVVPSGRGAVDQSPTPDLPEPTTQPQLRWDTWAPGGHVASAERVDSEDQAT
jgi:Subtilase family